MRVTGERARTVVAGGLMAALAAGLGACGSAGGTGPGTAPSLDASVIGPRADRVAALTKQPVIAALLSQGSTIGLPSFQRNIAGLQRMVAASLAPSRTSGGSHPTLAPAATRLTARSGATGTSSLIPDSLLGRTLVPNAQGHFVVDPARTGAPAAGVRFVIVTPGTTQELGYADLTDQIDATSELTVMDVVAGGTVLMHNSTVITTSATGEDDTARGYLTNGTDRIDFNFVIATTYRPVEDRTTGVLTIASPGIGISMIDSTVISGIAAADQQVGRLTIGNTTIRTVTPSVADPSGGYVASDTTHVTVNGAPYATIVNGASGVSYLSANGSQLPASDQAAFAGIEQIALAAVGLIVAQLVVTFWLLDATGF
jgi:hypothetical protein